MLKQKCVVFVEDTHAHLYTFYQTNITSAYESHSFNRIANLTVLNYEKKISQDQKITENIKIMQVRIRKRS